MLNILKATTSKALPILLFLVLTGNLASGQFAFEYCSRCKDCGWTTFPVGSMNAILMDWDLGFENLRVLPKLTVFWETSAQESDAELQKTRDQGHS
jgi:hypothetical protein